MATKAGRRAVRAKMKCMVNGRRIWRGKWKKEKLDEDENQDKAVFYMPLALFARVRATSSVNLDTACLSPETVAA
jgi:hypothetical protein